MDLTRFAEAAERLHVLGIKVTKDDELIGEWYYEPECRRNVYSATKSFTSCAVGFAVQEGLLSLDEKLTDAFREDLPDVVDENLQQATVRDLLTMCLGQEEAHLMGEQRPFYHRNRLYVPARPDFVLFVSQLYHEAAGCAAGRDFYCADLDCMHRAFFVLYYPYQPI